MTSEWKSVEKDGMPTEEGDYLIYNYEYFRYAIIATIYEYDLKHFVVERYAEHRSFPVPIVVTHYLKIPDSPRVERKEENENNNKNSAT